MDEFVTDFNFAPDKFVQSQHLVESLDRLEGLMSRACGTKPEMMGEFRELLKNIRLETQQLLRAQIQLTTLYKTGWELASILDMDDLLISLLDRAIRLVKAERGMLILHTDNENGFEIALARGIDKSEVEQNQKRNVSRQLIKHVLQHRQPLITTDAQNDSRFSASSSVVTFQIRSVLAVPLAYQEELIGAIYLDTRINFRAFDDDDLQLLNAMANQVSVAIHIAQLYDNLKAKNSELAAMLQELRATQTELIKTERLSAIGQMSSAIIHDIRGPLTNVKGLAEMLSRTDLSEEQRVNLSTTISRSVDSFVQMTQEILDYARGQQSVTLEQINVPQFLKSLRDFIVQDFATLDISVHLDINYEGDIMGDRQKLWRAFYNIAKNAGEAMSGEKGKDKVLIIASRRNDRWIEFALTDTGPGIPQELQDKIFLPFATYGKSHRVGALYRS